jgi:hypothetical protein
MAHPQQCYKSKPTFSQILISMGVDDLMAAKNMVMTALQVGEPSNRLPYYASFFQ